MTSKDFQTLLEEGCGRVTTVAEDGFPEGVVRVDLTGCTTKRAALGAIARAMGFGERFGMNLDALFDAITDVPDGSAGRVVALVGLGGLRKPTREGIEAAFSDAAAELRGDGIRLAVYRVA